MAKPLCIGINALYLIPGGVGGTEVYLRNLLAAIARNPRGHRYVVFLNRETGLDLVPAGVAFTTVQTGVAATSRPRRILYEQTSLLSASQRAGVDVLFNPGFTAPLLLRRPNVTIIHDLQHHRHPEHFKPADLLAWRFLVWAAAHTATRVVTVSSVSREDIHAVYGIPLERIDIAEPGVEPELFTLNREPRDNLIVCVSTLHPHKNIDRLIDAFAAFRVRRPAYRLVLAGMRGFHGAAVENRIRELALADSVTLTGWQPREEILRLYAQATFSVFPSTFEGFGMPVAEALAAGVPLITSDIRPMKDVAGEAALLFPPEDTGALASRMEEFAADPRLREEFAARGRVRAATYTWERAARVTLDALEAAL